MGVIEQNRAIIAGCRAGGRLRAKITLRGGSQGQTDDLAEWNRGSEAVYDM
jgi:hypothetical protein